MTDYSVNSSQLNSFISLKMTRTLRKRWIVVVAVGATVFAGVAAHTFTRIPVYESATLLLIENSTVPVSELPIPNSEGSLSQDVNLSTEIAILKSRPLLDSALSKLKNPNGSIPKESFLAQVDSNLNIRQEKGTRVLRLTYRDTDPHRAQDILNSLSKTYVEYSLTDRRSKSSSAINFVQSKLPQVKKQLDKSALAVTQFRKQNNIVDPDTYATSVYQMKQALELQVQDLQIKIDQTQQQYKQLQQQIGQPVDVALSSAILGQDTTYQNLVKQFQEAETSYFLERTRFQENHPTVQAIKDRRKQLYGLMQAQAQTVLGSKAAAVGVRTEVASTGGLIKQALATQLFETQTALAIQSAQLDSIKLAQSQVATVFAQIPQLQQSYTEIQRQLMLDSSTYTKLTEKLEELRISEAQEMSSWRVLDPAFLPIHPISPNILSDLLRGGIGGIALGIALAIWVDRLDERIKEIEEVRELTDIPLLGAIPRMQMLPTSTDNTDTKSQLALPLNYTHSAFTEALRSLALNLRYLGSDKSVKTIAFTSSLPSEGKSTIVFNLGLVLAELGHKVLIIDADMRRPTVHKLSGLGNAIGLSSAISTNQPWGQIVQLYAGQERLHVITSGPLPPNPIALLESAKMTKLLQIWHDTYDYVLIDTPPIVGISDAQSLSIKVDGVVLLAAMEHSTRSSIARAAEILVGNQCNIAGILINMLDTRHEHYYYSYYASYYQKNPRLPIVSESEDEKELAV